MPEKIFLVDDMLILKSPYVDFETEVSFRGYIEFGAKGAKGVVYNPKSGAQITIPLEWLRKKDLVPDELIQPLRDVEETMSQTLRKKGN